MELSETVIGVPLVGHFTVTLDPNGTPSRLEVETVSVSGSKITLTLKTHVVQNSDVVSVDYTKPGQNLITDGTNALESFTIDAVSINQDASVPTATFAANAGENTVQVRFSETVIGTPLAGNFPVTLNGEPVTVDRLDFTDPGDAMTLTLASYIKNTDTLQVAYTQPSDSAEKLVDAAGNALETITVETLTQVQDNTAPL